MKHSKIKWAIFFIIVLVFLVIISLLFWSHRNNFNKYGCDFKSDCILSGREPEGPAKCVNKVYYEEWKNNPESKKYIWLEAYTKLPECGCVSNKCERIK